MRLLLVPGTSPDRWQRVWRDRLPDDPLHVLHGSPAGAVHAVLDGDVDAAVLRLPPDGADTHPAGLPTVTPSTGTGWAVVPLWTEQTVAVVPREHVLTLVTEVDVADLAGETVIVPGDDVLGWLPPGSEPLEVPDVATAADLVVNEAGVLLVPHSLARLHDRRGTGVRVVPDAPRSPVVLVWRTDREHEHVQELVGIVRGRTVASSRGSLPDEPRGTARPGTGGKDSSSGRGAGGPARRPGPARPARPGGRRSGGGRRR